MKDFRYFIQQIQQVLINHLPGAEAQMLMAPASRNQQMKAFPENFQGTPSSVLILFFPDNGQIKIPFIKRPQYDGVHSGQIAFPGGKFEEEDNSLQTTALREANEEVGIDPARVSIIGNLTSLFIPPSRFNVLPVVAYTHEKPDFVADENEVDRIILISLDELLDEHNHTQKKIRISDGFHLDVPCLYIQGHVIWGATAMILSELIEVIKKADQ